MSSRRRHTRFALTSPWQGTLRTLRGVMVQPGDLEDELVVISEKPGLANETLTLDVLRNGDALGLTVRTVESHPVVHEGAVRHRLRMAVLKHEDRFGNHSMSSRQSSHFRGSQPGTLDAMFNGGDLFGVLGRDVPVRLLDISGSGCLLESRGRLEHGTTGGVRLGRKREPYRDDVRVTRCQALEGAGSVYLVGAEFLWTSHPGKRSLRRVIRRLQRDLRASGPS